MRHIETYRCANWASEREKQRRRGREIERERLREGLRNWQWPINTEIWKIQSTCWQPTAWTMSPRNKEMTQEKSHSSTIMHISCSVWLTSVECLGIVQVSSFTFPLSILNLWAAEGSLYLVAGISCRSVLEKLTWNRNLTLVFMKTGPLEGHICKQRRWNDTDAFLVVSFAALDTIRLAYCPDYLTWREGVERVSEVPKRNWAPFLWLSTGGYSNFSAPPIIDKLKLFFHSLPSSLQAVGIII